MVDLRHHKLTQTTTARRLPIKCLHSLNTFFYYPSVPPTFSSLEPQSKKKIAAMDSHHPTLIKFSSALRAATSSSLGYDSDEPSVVEAAAAKAVEEVVKPCSSAAVEDAPTVVTSATRLQGGDAGDADSSLVSCISDPDLQATAFKNRVRNWDGEIRYSEMIKSGLAFLGKAPKDGEEAIMLFESPSSANEGSRFFNNGKYRVHDYPPTSKHYKAVLGPCRYSSMNGSAYPSFLEGGAPPPGLVEHWENAIPGFVRPRFVSKIPATGAPPVYAYLPCEGIANHVNDPSVHYHCAGKDALHLMSDKAAALLPDTRSVRPCVAKTTHSMASKGIFVIRDDADEEEFFEWLGESGNPSYVVTEYVDIARNVACHFFLHPDGNVTWFGSNENRKDPDTGDWSMDSYLVLDEQEELKTMQLPFVKDVVQYCQSLGFWGFMGKFQSFRSVGLKII